LCKLVKGMVARDVLGTGMVGLEITFWGPGSPVGQRSRDSVPRRGEVAFP